jgi:DnaA N-terminal domain
VPLHQTIVRLSLLRVVADSDAIPGPPAAAAAQPTEAAVAMRFLGKLRQVVGPVQARTWLRDAAREDHPDGARLVLGSRFLADWIRTNFDQEIHDAARAVGLAAAPVGSPRRTPRAACAEGQGVNRRAAAPGRGGAARRVNPRRGLPAELGAGPAMARSAAQEAARDAGSRPRPYTPRRQAGRIRCHGWQAAAAGGEGPGRDIHLVLSLSSIANTS